MKRLFTIALAVCLLLALAACSTSSGDAVDPVDPADYARELGWNETLLELLPVSSARQLDELAQASRIEPFSASDGGFTVTVLQTLMDEKALYMVFELRTADDDMPVTYLPQIRYVACRYFSDAGLSRPLQFPEPTTNEYPDGIFLCRLFWQEDKSSVLVDYGLPEKLNFFVALRGSGASAGLSVEVPFRPPEKCLPMKTAALTDVEIGEWRAEWVNTSLSPIALYIQSMNRTSRILSPSEEADSVLLRMRDGSEINLSKDHGPAEVTSSSKSGSCVIMLLPFCIDLQDAESVVINGIEFPLS